MSRYLNKPQQRILQVIRALSGNEVTGIAPTAIVRDVGCDKSMVTRDLDNLRHAGYAEQVPATGNWRLTPSFVQFAVRMQLAVGRAEHELESTRNRFTRS